MSARSRRPRLLSTVGLGAAALLALGAAPAQAVIFDTTVRCTTDGAPFTGYNQGALVLRLQGVVESKVSPGEQVTLNVSSLGIALSAGPPPPIVPEPGSYPDTVSATIDRLDLRVAGATPSVISLEPGTKFGPVAEYFGGRSAVGAVTSPSGKALEFSTTVADAASPALVFRLGAVHLTTSETTSVRPGAPAITRTFDCTEALGEPPFARTTNVGPLPAPPAITGVSPSTGVAGDRVTISGSGLSTVRSVALRNVARNYPPIYADDVRVVDDRTIEATIPDSSFPDADLVALGDFGESADTAADDFDFTSLSISNRVALVRSVSPATARPGDVITVRGQALAYARVTFGSIPAVVALGATDDELIVTVPKGVPAGPTAFTVQGSIGSARGHVQILPPLAQSGPVSLSPAAISRFTGGFVKVTGRSLRGTKVVLIGTRSVKPFLILGDTQLWIYAPPLAAGRYPVRTRTATGASTPTVDQAPQLTYR